MLITYGSLLTPGVDASQESAVILSAFYFCSADFALPFLYSAADIFEAHTMPIQFAYDGH